MSHFLLANLISAVNNGQRSYRRFVDVRFCRMSIVVLTLLYREGYISGFSILSVKIIRIFLKYFDSCIVCEFELISKPSQRVYFKLTSKDKRIGVLSTSSGILPIFYAKLLQVGGEFLFLIKKR